MRLAHPLFSIACVAAALSWATPAWAQVYKCQRPDGRIEYSGTPCGSGSEQQLSIQGSRPATPASSAPARPPGQVQPSDGRRVDDKGTAAVPKMDLRLLDRMPGGPLYYDAASIVRNGAVISVRLVVSPVAASMEPLPNGRRAGSVVTDIEYDCQARRLRNRASKAYAEPGLAGAVLHQEPEGKWQPMDMTLMPPRLYTLTCGAGR